MIYTHEQEAKLKEDARCAASAQREAAEQQYCVDWNTAPGASTGNIGPDYLKGCDTKTTEPRHSGLRSRAGEAFRAAQHQAQHADRLAELMYLLDKNPHVARILDLIDQIGAQ